MDRRTLLALALSFLVIVIYTRFIQPPPRNTAAPDKREVAAVEVPTPVATRREAVPNTGPLPVALSEPKGKLSTVKTRTMEVEFSSAGGCISNLTLLKSSVIKKGPVRVVQTLQPASQLVALRVGFARGGDADVEYVPEPAGGAAGTVEYRRDFGPVRVRKSYHVRDEGYVIDTETAITNNGRDRIVFDKGIEIGAGSVIALTASEKGAHVGVDRLDAAGRITRVGAGKAAKGARELKPARWFALRNQFFAVILKPAEETAGWSAREIITQDGVSGIEGALRTAPIAVNPGESKVIRLSVYAGPKEYTALSTFGAAEIIDFGWFGFVGKWILLGLNWLYRICGNYGVAIILLTVVIRAILYPLNQKSFRSMKEMQKLQPEITAVQQKYKADPKKSQAEMMKLYKEHGVNPMGGCLPLLIQMPILIAFFRVLQNAIELWGAPFCLWMTDLSEPDALFKFQTGRSAWPFIGRMVDGHGYVFLNVLPILMLAVFYIQQKMTPTAMAATPEQQQQQKLMGVMMPLMFGVIFYNMPAGLNLYFAASTLLGIIQQKYMIK